MKKFCGLLLVVIFTACSPVLNKDISYQKLLENRSKSAISLEKNSTKINCEANKMERYDAFRLNNNLWGENKLKSGKAELCTYFSNEGIGWKWSVPENAKGVIGYPAIQKGPGPWGQTATLDGFPIQINQIQQLTADFDTEIYVKHRKYNLAFDVWVSSEFPSSKEKITTEIMVWEDYFDFNSYGKKVAEISTPFGDYVVMSGYLKNEKAQQDWQYYAFVRKEKRQTGTVDLAYLIQYLVENQGLNPINFITSVEFGNEIGNSSGFTWVKKYELKVN